MSKLTWTVYLSGEVHTNWREQLIQGCAASGIPVACTSAVSVHEASDAAGDHLGVEPSQFWRDHKSAKVNAIRTRTLIKQCDIAVVRFGPQYKQWNAAFDAGYAAALGKPMITLHDDALTHALKEVDAAALAVAQTPEQVVEILRYVTMQA
ncbi:MAG: YtoQ family protein [Phycisphaerales bacterium]|nr:YtoQ family protein [Phycisphaerales bacterium]